MSFIDLSTAFCISNQWYMKDSFVVRLISIVLSVIFTSFYFFTFKFTYFGGANTKTVFAGLGIVVLLYQMIRDRRLGISKELIIFTSYALIVSLFCMCYRNVFGICFCTVVYSCCSR